MGLPGKKIIYVGCAFLAGVLSGQSATRGKSAPGADLFAKPRVLAIQIEIAPNELNALRRNNREHVRSTIREGTNVWRDVGIHLKGAAGSFRDINDKAAFTLNFTKFTPGQKFHGLKKLHLNNSVQDGSYMTEYICGELFREAGVPAARTTFATVAVNGKQKGFYVLKEGFAKEMLGLYFKNVEGNLYDGGFLREVTDQLEKDMGDEDVNDWSDLKALAAAAQEPDATKRFDELSKVLDVERFLSFAALEAITWDWDGYIMNRNNYRVFHDLDSGKMVFLPHGMDQMFWQADGPIMPGAQGLVAQGLIKTPQGRKLYRRRVGEVYTNVFKLEVLTNHVAQLAAVIRPTITNLHGRNAGREYDGQIQRMHDLILQRHASIGRQLNEPLPKPIAFDNNVAKLTRWEIAAGIPDQGSALRDKAAVDGRQTLHIQTRSVTSASWRTRVLLEAGRYRFEAMVKTAGVVPVRNPQKGEGAGIRHSGIQNARRNKVAGDSPWQKVTYEFDVPVDQDEIVLVCELRASRGDAWFDTDSLKLVRLP